MKITYVKHTLFLIFMVSSFLGVSQDLTKRQLRQVLKSSNESELVQTNTSLIINESYYHAFLTAEKLLTFQPKNPNYNYRVGFAILNLSDDYTKSLPYLERAVSNITKNFDMVSTHEKGAPIEALYYMGSAYHLANQLDKAIDYYQQFIEFSDSENSYYDKAKVGIQQCENAKELLKTPHDYTVNNIGNVINSEAPEYSTVVSLDGTSLYFTSRRLYPDSSNIDIKEPGTNLYLEDIYVSHKNEMGEWSKPEMMDFCKPEYNEATVAVSVDERKIYAYKDQTGNGDVYYSKFENNKFQELKRLPDEGVNTQAWEPHISVSPDGRKKYFVSDRAGGYGGRDIYVIEQLKNGEWSEPKNLGPTINTPYDEDAPFMAIDNKTMYFSHNGKKSMGGFDIFKTRLDKDGNWSEPENMGAPINTTSDEIYYTTTFDGATGYFTSYRKDGFGEKDIYGVKNKGLKLESINVFLGEIINQNQTKIPEDLFFTIQCLDCEMPYQYKVYPRISDGSFFVSLDSCQQYEITLNQVDKETDIFNEKLKTSCTQGYDENYRLIVLDDELQEIVNSSQLIPSYQPLAMKHFFGYNKNALDPKKGAFKLFLDSLNSQINKGRTEIVININASASKVPTQTFKKNDSLAMVRAQNVKTFLTRYFNKIGLSETITLKINNVYVSGPDYQSDYKKLDKYIPYQYVELSTTGFNSVDNTLRKMTSIDSNLKEHNNIEEKPQPHKFTDHQGDLFTSGEMIESEYNFHIIIGVFKNKVFAEGMINKANQLGYDAKMIDKHNGMHMVSVAKRDTKAKAKQILKQVRQDVIESAWIFNIKK